MVKMFETTPFSGVDISILIILIGALILFFGRIISDTQIKKYDKLGYYIIGLEFSLWYIFIPGLLIYSILYTKNIFRFSISVLILIFIQIIIYIILSITIGAYTSIKYGLLNEIKKLVERELNQISFLGKLIRNLNDSESNDLIPKVLSILFSETPIKLFGNPIALFIFSSITILSSILLYKSEEALISISLVLTFYILTMVALSYGFNDANYPLAKIYLVNGAIIEGKILKSGDYIYVLKDGKHIFINKDKINYVEES